MSQLDTKNLENYISTSLAASLVGYSSDYVAKLARERKVKAFRKNRQWFVDKDSVKLFHLNSEAEKRKRQDILKYERIREHAKALLKVHENKRISKIQTMTTVAWAETFLIVISVFLVSNILWFSFESRLNTMQLFTGLSNISNQLSEIIIKPIPRAISQVASFAFVKNNNYPVISDTANFNQLNSVNGVSSEDSAFQGIVLFDKSITSVDSENKIQKSFSDDVEVEFVKNNSGFVKPIFKEKTGEAYKFLLVPVPEKDFDKKKL